MKKNGLSKAVKTNGRKTSVVSYVIQYDVQTKIVLIYQKHGLRDN